MNSINNIQSPTFNAKMNYKVKPLGDINWENVAEIFDNKTQKLTPRQRKNGTEYFLKELDDGEIIFSQQNSRGTWKHVVRFCGKSLTKLREASEETIAKSLAKCARIFNENDINAEKTSKYLSKIDKKYSHKTSEGASFSESIWKIFAQTFDDSAIKSARRDELLKDANIKI